ncbi:DUF218 domain [[Clostridium] sordellii]|uniref:YdcF family protein n=1 Tax=Paraclostridium sordellii TaxID=1505 RepID=UPI0005E20BA9|nr:YdcF family protein [Paeniclostridium sordellii]CEQ11946.1 DUF218 domain [[Clostridium] sordellii] [Paeniclostridium sordellii]
MIIIETVTNITNFIFLKDDPEKSDIIFIPGGSFPEPSGKYSPSRNHFTRPSSKSYLYNGIYITEWDFSKDVLLKNGVDKNSILKENCAQNTYENAFNSRKITDTLGLNISKAIICCKSYHARRCFLYYKCAYPNTKLLICPSDVDDISRYNWFDSEKGIDQVLSELSKTKFQFKDYLKKISS